MTRLSITFVVLVMALPELVAQTADPLSSSAPFWPSVWPSVFANVLYTVGIIATFYLVKGLGRRRQLVNFFADEVAPETKITIFQSVFSTGSNETFVNHDEAKLSRRLESLFNNPLPILSEDNWFRETIQIAGSTCHITHMLECQDSSVFSGNCIVVGSPAFNPVAEAFERFLKPPVHFEMVDTDSGRVTLRVVALGGTARQHIRKFSGYRSYPQRGRCLYLCRWPNSNEHCWSNAFCTDRLAEVEQLERPSRGVLVRNSSSTWSP